MNIFTASLFVFISVNSMVFTDEINNDSENSELNILARGKEVGYNLDSCIFIFIFK